VPIAPKQDALMASSRLASSITIVALFPPSSKIDFPNLYYTAFATILPTNVDPVNETTGIHLSAVIN
jgi:hypothetical protein